MNHNDGVRQSLTASGAIEEHQAVMTNGDGTTSTATQGNEAGFEGFAEYGAADGELFSAKSTGTARFIAGEALAPADNNAKLKLGAVPGQLVKANAAERYVAIYRAVDNRSTAGSLGIGHHGTCIVEKGVA